MTPNDVLKKYGSGYKFHKQTGMSHTSLGLWLKTGYVPEISQFKLECLTNGELKSEWTLKREKNLAVKIQPAPKAGKINVDKIQSAVDSVSKPEKKKQ